MFITIVIQLYNLLFSIILLPIILIRLWIKSFKFKAYRQRILERLGIFELPANYQKENNIWIHAVSVGEINATIPIIQQLKNVIPEISIILTCTTPRGSEIILQKLKNLVFHVYLPFDINFAIKNFLIRTNAKILLLIEKEIWPNIIFNCHKNQIPIIIANAQLSNKSFRRYYMIKSMISWLLTKIKFICTQTKFDSYKFKKLLPKQQNHHVILVGNTKFDLAYQYTESKINNSNIVKPCKKVWIAASTHNLEEQIILKAHSIILTELPDTILILVPRHPERINSIITEIIKENLNFIQYTQQPNFNQKHINKHIYLVDVIGQLNNLYQFSQAAFVGGSLIPNVGGHNVLEPAALGLPITVGPYTANCQQIVANLKLTNGLHRVSNSEDLAYNIKLWLTNEKLRNTIGNNAKNYLIQQTGATKIIVELITKNLQNLNCELYTI